MKRVLTIIGLISSLTVGAQLQKSYSFDFSKPLELRPSVQTEDYNGASVSLSSYEFISDDGAVAITFNGRTDDGQSGLLVTGWEQDDGTFDHFLFISRGGGITFKGYGVDLDALIFERNSKIGNLVLKSPSDIGHVDPAYQNWYSDGAKGVTSLYYQNMGQTPEIRGITIRYTVPLDKLEPISIVPSNNSQLHSFKTFDISFNEEIELGENPKFELTGPIGFNPISLIPSVVGMNLILALPDGTSINESEEDLRGVYHLYIAENSIVGKTGDHFYNKDLTLTYTLVQAYDKFLYAAISPAAGDVDEIPNKIIIEFPTGIGKFSSDQIKLYDRDRHPIRSIKAQWIPREEYSVESFHDKDRYNFLELVFTEDKSDPVNASGIYTITIPEGFVWNDLFDADAEDKGISAGALFNPEFTIEYNVNGVVYPSDEVLQAAKDLLAVTGAGYPAADSPARLALQALIEEGVGADAVFEEAMAAFYAETVIELPKDGYYLLSAVNPEGNQVYIGYDDGKVVLTRDEEVAAHLLATVNHDGTIFFKTPDGKYLTQLALDQNNVSNSYEAKKNDFTFSKLEVEGNTPKELFGLWIIHSWLRTTDEGVDKFAYALVNFQTNVFETSDERERRYFDTTRSNAFRLTETDAPVPDVTYTLSPSAGAEMESLYYITLTFGSDTKDVKLVDKSGIVLKGTSTRQYVPTKIVNNGQQFIFYFDDVAAGTYTLTIPKGAFTYTYNEKTITIKAISATYHVNSSAAFAEDFLYMYSTYYYNFPKIDTFVRDVDLNTFSMVIYDQGKYGLDTNKAITITDVAGSQEYARGHFVFDNDFKDEDGTPMTHIVLVMDNPIEYGTLPAQTYCYNIPAGTFGDENFAVWLTDPQNKKKGDCHVNAYLTPMISVDNDRGNMIVEPQPITSVISKLSDITITFPYFENVSIQATNVIEVLERYTGRTITTSMVLVEGTTNKYRFASDEILTADTSNGGYMIVIPQNFFKAGAESFPGIRDMELFFYAKGGDDAIEAVEAAQPQGVIFDLSGRRVKDMSKAGMYIVGGRKVVVR